MTDIRTMKPPKIIPNTNNPAVAMGLKLMEQQRKKKEKEAKQKEKKEKKTKRAPIWAVDFEGVITVKSKFPKLGDPNVQVIELLKLAKLQGVRLILWTCREGQYLTDALDYCREYGLEFDAVNANVPEAIDYLGCDTRKVIADLYIEDKSMNFHGEEGEQMLCQLMQKL